MEFMNYQEWKDKKGDESLNEIRFNPQVGYSLVNDKKLKEINKSLANWFRSKISYVQSNKRDYYRDLVIEEIIKELTNLKIN